MISKTIGYNGLHNIFRHTHMMYPIASLEPGGLCLVVGFLGVWKCTKIQEVSTVFFNTETSGIDPPLAPDLAAAFALASNKYGFFACQKLPEAGSEASLDPGGVGLRSNVKHGWQEFCNLQEKQKNVLRIGNIYIYIYVYVNRFTYESIIIIKCLNIIEHFINIY